jgi:hypothetical protein
MVGLSTEQARGIYSLGENGQAKALSRTSNGWTAFTK